MSVTWILTKNMVKNENSSFFTIININFSASSLSIRPPSMGNVWNISTSTCISQTCHLNCDNRHTKRSPTQKWNVPYGFRCFVAISILMVRALPIISHLAGCDTELQDEDDRRRAFVHHSSHPAIPESTQSYDTTRCKRRIKQASDVWCVHHKR